MIYVALLRGINVGGNAKVEMSRLKTVFEALGCQNVSTYINSGNVIFSDTRKPKELVSLIEQAIQKEFNLAVPVVVRDLPNIKKLCKEIPMEWVNDQKEYKTDVMFLWGEVDNPEILQKIVIKPDLENVLYLDGALVWNVNRKNVRRGFGLKLIGTDLYKQMSIRNINTVRKLEQLMSAQAGV